MNRAPDFDPVVVSLPHRFPGSASFGGEEAVHLLLTHEGVPHLRCPSADDTALTMVMSLTPSLVFRQAPWDDDLPPSLSTRSLDFVRLAYVPYGLMTAAIEDKQFDQEFHRACWRIFAPVPGHCELAAAHSQVAASNCVVTGYPKFDELVSAAAEPGLWPIEPREGTRLRLIWAPHFSRSGDWLRFGAFDLVAGPLLQWTAEHPDVDVVLRPHPALLEEMREAPDDSDLGRFRFAWDQLPNTAVSSEADYSRLFAASDVLLTDGLSFLSEYQLFDKPVVFFERSDHVGFNEIGQVLLQGLYRVESIDPMIEMLETMLEGFDDPLAPARREVVAQVHCYPGEAATRILTEIRHGLGRPAPGDA